MGRYLVVNSHMPEQCEAMESDLDQTGPALKGVDFLCTCPAGEHGYYMVLEGDSSEQVLRLLPPSLRGGKTRAVAVEVFRL